MKKVLLSLLLVCVIGSSGCVIVRPRASTVLTIHRDDDTARSRTLGFRDASWASIDNRFTVIARGWHPREHETYAFFVNEPYYGPQPRWFVLSETKEAAVWDVDLWLFHYSSDDNSESHVTHFTGRVQFSRPIAGNKFSLELNDLMLTSSDGHDRVSVSAEIVAEPATPDRIKERMKARMEEIRNY